MSYTIICAYYHGFLARFIPFIVIFSFNCGQFIYIEGVIVLAVFQIKVVLPVALYTYMTYMTREIWLPDWQGKFHDQHTKWTYKQMHIQTQHFTDM